MSKDVILDKYARLYEIPNQLAHLGHQVDCFCLSYQSHNEGTWNESNNEKKLIWHSKSYKGLKKIGLISYPFYLLKKLRQFQPDIVIAASDIPHIVISSWLAKKLRVPFVADLYDNFEGFGQARLPGFVKALRYSVRNADMVLTTSIPLKHMVENVYQTKGKVLALPSTIDNDIFYPMDKRQCRLQLGLPPDAILIGTAGGLLKERGIGEFYDAWNTISTKYANAYLVLAGPIEVSFPPPKHDRVIYKGMLTHKQTAKLFNALDVGVIYLRDTAFGRYCFPQKLYEMVACNLSVVGADVGVMPYLMQALKKAIYQPDNINDLIRAIEFQITQKKVLKLDIGNWEQVIGDLDTYLEKISTNNNII